MLTKSYRMRRLMTPLIFIICNALIYSLCGQPFYNTSIPNKYVEENVFLKKIPDSSIPPDFQTIRSLLPEPYWPSNPGAVKSYWRLWELEFAHVRKVTRQNGFVAPYVEPPFNGHIFMWDACFMTLFGRYGGHAFNFQQTYPSRCACKGAHH